MSYHKQWFIDAKSVLRVLVTIQKYLSKMGAVRGSDGLVVGFITTYANSDFESHSWRGVLNTTLCDKVCQWFSPATPVSSTSKTDRHDITEILLKVALKKCRRYRAAIDY